MKDVPLDLLDQYKGTYLDVSPLVATLQDDLFTFEIEGKRKIRTSRWMMLDVNQVWRTRNSDHIKQYHENTEMPQSKLERSLMFHPFSIKSSQSWQYERIQVRIRE